MNTLIQLEQRLQREVPLLVWHCQSCEAMQTVSSSGIPDEIEITFSLSGRPLDGSPFHLSGATLTRWGVEITVRMICSELKVVTGHVASHPPDDWDKLSEL